MQGLCGSVAAPWVDGDADGAGHPPVDASGLRHKPNSERDVNMRPNRSPNRVEHSSHQPKGFKGNHQRCTEIPENLSSPDCCSDAGEVGPGNNRYTLNTFVMYYETRSLD